MNINQGVSSIIVKSLKGVLLGGSLFVLGIIPYYLLNRKAFKPAKKPVPEKEIIEKKEKEVP